MVPAAGRRRPKEMADMSRIPPDLSAVATIEPMVRGMRG
jgi:hypothetical protein